MVEMASQSMLPPERSYSNMPPLQSSMRQGNSQAVTLQGRLSFAEQKHQEKEM